jgi:hypothetical protein
MQKIIFVASMFSIFFLLASCAKTVEAPVVITPDTSLSGSSDVVWQEVLNQIGEITQKVEEE